MSTPLYSIFVRERDGSHLTIYVSSFHLRETLPNPANPTFFLSILCHENYQGSLLEAVVGERHVDEDWMAEQAPAYISTVTLLEIEDYPPQSGEYGVQPGAAYRLTASHPDWIAHLNRGALWETSAYQIPPSRHVTSNGKPWEALFRDLMKNWKEKNWKNFRVNDEILQHLIDALDCEDEDIATEATQWLERIEEANAAVPRLLWALDDRNHTVRDASLYTLGAIKDSRAVPSLLCHLHYCDKEERWGCQGENISALLALLHLGQQVTLALETVERCAASTNMQQRLTSLLALYQITDKEVYLERFLFCYQEHQGEWYYFCEVVSDFSSLALLKLLPALLEKLEHEGLEALILGYNEPICMALRRLGTEARDALPVLHHLAAQKKTYQNKYSEEEIAEAVGLLEQTMVALGEASVSEQKAFPDK